MDSDGIALLATLSLLLRESSLQKLEPRIVAKRENASGYHRKACEPVLSNA
jgi:hypothetical protein